MSKPRIVMTEEMFMAGSHTDEGSWTDRQLRLMAVQFPLRAGWMSRCIGRKIAPMRYERFLAAKGRGSPQPRPPRFADDPILTEEDIDDSSVTLTNELIVAGSTSTRGTWTYRQLRLLGVSMPPKKGWKHSVIGNEIPTSQYERFLALKHGKGKSPAPSGFFPEFACTAKPDGYSHPAPRVVRCLGACRGQSRPGSNYCGPCWDRLRAKLKPPKK